MGTSLVESENQSLASIKEELVNIHSIVTREDNGRDTISRFHAQFRAAAYASLRILESNSVDRVYCDYHDDFVVRENINSIHIYHFYQVKTKGKTNHLWDVPEIIGINKKIKTPTEKITNSFVGKLLIHTVKFKNSCGSVIFLTNVNFADDVEALIQDLKEEKYTDKNTITLVDNFNECFVDDEYSDSQIKECLQKLKLESNVVYLSPNDTHFHALARDMIYKYSEIDLQNIESKEIVESLISLVEKKSYTTMIASLDKEALDEQYGVGINDLLKILSISKNAYEILRAGGDPQAIKNASIIQRLLSDEPSEIIEYCSRVKTDWDIWVRKNRHIIPEFDFNSLNTRLNSIVQKLSTKKITFYDIQQEINDLEKNLNINNLTKDLLLGGVFSFLVRKKS